MAQSISELIRFRRRQLKITQPHLAELADVNVNTIARIERGQANPTFDVLTKIADVLGMEFQLIIRKDNGPAV
ncbi:MAG: helix-turn-helix transcriptional regulator [Daejeonella sp.]|uniref:helix-turn-helix transcriptional regulator n=1 Tax=Daejeonella sp. TaxID=2805397 RepID=UPI003C763BB0